MANYFYGLWDNGGKTADRYAVGISNESYETQWFTMSKDANMPNGVNMCIEQPTDEYLLTLGDIAYWELPTGTQLAIQDRIKNF